MKNGTGDDAFFLSNLAGDPGERHNLRHRYPALVDELESDTSKWQKNASRSHE